MTQIEEWIKKNPEIAKRNEDWAKSIAEVVSNRNKEKQKEKQADLVKSE